MVILQISRKRFYYCEICWIAIGRIKRKRNLRNFEHTRKEGAMVTLFCEKAWGHKRNVLASSPLLSAKSSNEFNYELECPHYVLVY